MNIADKLTQRKSYEQYYHKVSAALERPGSQASGLVSLTIFTVVFFVVFAIIPTFKTIAALTREIEDAKTTEAKLIQKIHSLEQAEILYNQVLPQLGKIDQVLPPLPEFERLAWQLFWLAGKNNVALDSGAFNDFVLRGPIAADDAEGGLIVDVSVQGGFAEVKNFIADLEQLDRLLKIQEIILTTAVKESRGEAVGKINATFKLQAYYLPI